MLFYVYSHIKLPKTIDICGYTYITVSTVFCNGSKVFQDSKGKGRYYEEGGRIRL